MDEILTVEEVSDYLKLSHTTVWRWCRDGKLPAFRIGHQWRIRGDELEKLIRADMVSLRRQDGSGDVS